MPSDSLIVAHNFLLPLFVFLLGIKCDTNVKLGKMEPRKTLLCIIEKPVCSVD